MNTKAEANILRNRVLDEEFKRKARREIAASYARFMEISLRRAMVSG